MGLFEIIEISLNFSNLKNFEEQQIKNSKIVAHFALCSHFMSSTFTFQGHRLETRDSIRVLRFFKLTMRADGTQNTTKAHP